MHKPLFIGHGSPMNAITDKKYARFLRAYGQSIPKPEVIGVVSAHWLTKGTYITGNEHPEQIMERLKTK
jgi:4,5-DOPA dioxygenase extradiol